MANLTINSPAKIRRVSEGGRDFLVAPMSLINPGILNGSQGALLYTPEDCKSTINEWSGIPIVVYHPTRNGVNVSASAPGVIDESGIGQVRNPRFDRKSKAEGWFDVEKTRQVDNNLPEHIRILPRLERGQPIELSTGLFTDNDPTPGLHKGREYDAVARNHRPDHLAVLPDQVGACSINDGCGVSVNQLTVNSWSQVMKPTGNGDSGSSGDQVENPRVDGKPVKKVSDTLLEEAEPTSNVWSEAAREAASDARKASATAMHASSMVGPQHAGLSDKAALLSVKANDASATPKTDRLQNANQLHHAAADAHRAAADYHSKEQGEGHKAAAWLHGEAANAHREAAYQHTSGAGMVSMAHNEANFASEGQRKFMWSQHPDIAEDWAHGEHSSDSDHKMPGGPGPDVKGPQAEAARKKGKKRTNNAWSEAAREAAATAREAASETSKASKGFSSGMTDKAMDASTAASKHATAGNFKQAAESHRDAGLEHRGLAAYAEKVGNPEAAAAHEKAASMHFDAARKLSNNKGATVANEKLSLWQELGRVLGINKWSEEAIQASIAARRAGEGAGDTHTVTSGGELIPRKVAQGNSMDATHAAWKAHGQAVSSGTGYKAAASLHDKAATFATAAGNHKAAKEHADAAADLRARTPTGNVGRRLSLWKKLGRALGLTSNVDDFGDSSAPARGVGFNPPGMSQPRHPGDGTFQGKVDVAARRGSTHRGSEQAPEEDADDDGDYHPEIGQGDRPAEPLDPNAIGVKTDYPAGAPRARDNAGIRQVANAEDDDDEEDDGDEDDQTNNAKKKDDDDEEDDQNDDDDCDYDMVGNQRIDDARSWLVYNRDWPQDKRDKLDKKDFAGPEQSFPIATQEDLDAAVKSIGRTKHDPSVIKAGIRRIAKRKNLKLPDSWRSDKMATNAKKCPKCGADMGDGPKCVKCGHMVGNSQVNNDFASDEQRRAFFGHLAYENSHSGRAGAASKKAMKSGKASDHAAAHEAHKKAAAYHRQGGNDEKAAQHSQAASYHLRKSKATQNRRNIVRLPKDPSEREARLTELRPMMLNFLTTNCSCSKERAAYNDLNNETLRVIYNAKAQGSNADVIGDGKGIEAGNKDDSQEHTSDKYKDDEADALDDDIEFGDDSVPNKKMTDNQRNHLSMELLGVPLKVAKSAISFVAEKEAQARRDLLERLTANAQSDKLKRAAWELYSKMSLADLRRAAAVLPPADSAGYYPDARTLSANYLGAAGGPVDNYEAPVDNDPDDILQLPTVNYEELSKEQRAEDRNRRKA